MMALIFHNNNGKNNTGFLFPVNYTGININKSGKFYDLIMHLIKPKNEYNKILVVRLF